MPAEAKHTKTLMGNGTIDKRNENLNHIGAVHDPASARGPHLHPVGMYHELQRLHADAIQKNTTKSHPSTRNGNLNTQRPDQPRSASVAEAAQNEYRHPTLPVLERSGMRHWYTEGPHDQPWNSLQLGTGAAYEHEHKKA
ncbi:hypothetical protein EPUS_06748 [Endocarpon pusillum Z07020]|uniref:Uncharacterized protein n=1 Tax=Endocarpon pusillum (strain Z07020 / HMAS-L-300199) TaxID=1263415 RepID=U1GFS4_ENDPU|nr:uncharacterized protein EPUS_06748 [Endocarpon pusillum Z07020]ERF70963.1 hypothetical protein EPUS_06748 [Endocarpon pusillum Z07020]